MGDPSTGDGADPPVLVRRVEQLSRAGEDAFRPAAVQLQESLQPLAGGNTTHLLRAVQDLHHAVGDAQCHQPLAPWLRWLGRTRGAGLRFQSDCREVMACHPRVLERTRGLAETHRPQAAQASQDLDLLLDAADRLGAAVGQAQSLLAGAWERLMPQRPDPADPRSLQDLRALLGEVDRQRASLQRLDLACTGARDVVRLGRAVVAGRGELLALVDGRLARTWEEWSARVDPLLREGMQTGQLVAGARDATAARRGLLLALDHVRAVCTRLQIDEQALAHALTQLREQLAALPESGADGTRGHPPDA